MHVEHSFLRRGWRQCSFLARLNSLGLQTSLGTRGVTSSLRRHLGGEACTQWGVWVEGRHRAPHFPSSSAFLFYRFASYTRIKRKISFKERFTVKNEKLKNSYVGLWHASFLSSVVFLRPAFPSPNPALPPHCAGAPAQPCGASCHLCPPPPRFLPPKHSIASSWRER